MHSVIWSEVARRDLTLAFQFLSDVDIRAANKMIDSITHASELIGSQPRIGRILDDGQDRREFSVSFGSGAYVLRYRIHPDKKILTPQVFS